MKAYQVKIKLEGLDVWRRVVIPSDITFKALHKVIQYSMGWWNSHLYRFDIQEERLVLVDTPDEVEEYNFMNSDDFPRFGRLKVEPKCYKLSSKVKIDKFLNQYGKLAYIYDMGDNWEHEITLEKVIEDYPNVYPVCIEAQGACPPEDCGGVSGYLDFLDIIEDTEHPMYDEIMEWLKCSDFEEEFDLEETNQYMASDLKLKRIKKAV